ncbi:MAG: M48 family metalloprotease [Ignavibacteriales bacterium]|nr:M48 family metalloprotease [Ignavibacteriales bacterium]
MNLILEAQEATGAKRRNKVLTVLVMAGFAFSFALFGYGFDFLMGKFRSVQLVTIPVAIVYVGSLLYNLVNGLNDRWSANSLFADLDPKSESEREKNKIFLWMAWITFVVLVWELSFLGQTFWGKPKTLLIVVETSPYGVIAGALLGIGTAFSSLQWGAYSILRSLTTALPDQTSEGDQLLVKSVEEISKAAGISAPSVYIVPDNAPNAFSLGRSPKHASLVVSEGLLETLSPEELNGVLSHEMSHIRNYDIRPRTAVTALFGSAILLSSGVENLAIPRASGVKRILLLAFWFASLLFVPVARAALVILTFRHREYVADASAAQLTRNPRALATALAKIEQGVGSSVMIRGNVAHLCIIDPFNGSANSKEGWFADIVATHPPTPKRAMLLESMVPHYTSGESERAVSFQH